MSGRSRALSEAAVAGAWAALFWFLLWTDRTSLYLGARTTWLVPLGGALMTIVAVGRALTAHREPIDRRGAAGLGVLALPVAILMLAAPGTLGAFAASARSPALSQGYSSDTGDLSAGELSLADVAGAVRSRDGMAALVERAGEEVTFTGFVTRPPTTPPDEFVLTRFVISCCVADALAVEVRVVGVTPGRFATDDWVRVRGALYPLGREVVVDASEVTEVDRPRRPYLSP